MTTVPEAVLMRTGICYATVAMVTNRRRDFPTS